MAYAAVVTKVPAGIMILFMNVKFVRALRVIETVFGSDPQVEGNQITYSRQLPRYDIELLL